MSKKPNPLDLEDMAIRFLNARFRRQWVKQDLEALIKVLQSLQLHYAHKDSRARRMLVLREQLKSLGDELRKLQEDGDSIPLGPGSPHEG